MLCGLDNVALRGVWSKSGVSLEPIFWTKNSFLVNCNTICYSAFQQGDDDSILLDTCWHSCDVGGYKNACQSILIVSSMWRYNLKRGSAISKCKNEIGSSSWYFRRYAKIRLQFKKHITVLNKIGSVDLSYKLWIWLS